MNCSTFFIATYLILIIFQRVVSYSSSRKLWPLEKWLRDFQRSSKCITLQKTKNSYNNMNDIHGVNYKRKWNNFGVWLMVVDRGSCVQVVGRGCGCESTKIYRNMSIYKIYKNMSIVNCAIEKPCYLYISACVETVHNWHFCRCWIDDEAIGSLLESNCSTLA